MSLITLPPYLPQCSLRADWSMTPVSPNKRTEMDDGETAVQQRFARTQSRVQMGWELDAHQFDIAVHFWQVDLRAGRSWFLCPASTGRGTILTQSRFAADPPWTVTSPHNGIFKLAFELELREMPILTTEERMAFNIYVEERGEIEGITASLQEVITALEGLPQWP